MKRWAAASLVVVVVLALVAWTVWPAPEVPSPSPVAAPDLTLRAAPGPPVPAEAATSGAPAAAPVAVDYEARVSAVAASCGLDVETVCEGERCVALSVSPDLDRPLGWMALMMRSPRFVMSTALRDLGMPVDFIPCGGAIERLVQGGSVPAVELPDGTEVWCAAESPEELALCDEAAVARLGPGAFGFSSPDVRRLTFVRAQR